MEPSATQSAPPPQSAATLQPAPQYLSAISQKLADMGFLGRLQRQVDEAVLYNDVTAAASILRDLGAFLRGTPDAALRYPEQYPLIMRIKRIAQWVALNTLQPDEVLDLFQNHLTVALALPDFELWEHVRLWLLNSPLRTERDGMKKRLREAMEGNHESFGSAKNAAIAGDPRTLGAWMSRFFTVVGREKAARAFEINTFLNRDQSVKRLTVVAQRQLRRFLELYERLQHSSQTLEGFEDTVSVDDSEFKGTFSDGRYDFFNREEEKRVREELDDLRSFLADAYGTEAPPSLVGSLAPIKLRQVNADRLLDIYVKWSQEQVFSTARALLGVASTKVEPGAAGKWLVEWFEAVNKKDAGGVMFGLWRLARAGKVREQFGSSKRYQEYWRKHLPPALKEKEQEFDKDPAAPEFLLGFFRHVLEERLKMKEEDAKLVVLTMSNEARKAGEEEYAKLAFGDLQTGEFQWGGFTPLEN